MMIEDCFGSYSEGKVMDRFCSGCVRNYSCQQETKQRGEFMKGQLDQKHKDAQQAMNHSLSATLNEISGKLNTADILQQAAKTFSERNAIYGDNYKMVGKLMKVLFPKGAPPELLHSDQFHLFELKLVKLSRFAISGLQHIDSIHDDCVYSAMIEAILTGQGAYSIKQKGEDDE